MMNALLIAVLLAASGDPYCRWSTPQVTLTSGQRTTLGNHIATKWPTVALADVARFECGADLVDGCDFACRPVTNTTATGAAIRSQLIAGIPWIPGQTAGTYSNYWPAYCYAGSAMTAVRNFVNALAAETTGNPLLSALFTRAGTNINAVIGYKRPMSAADCTTYSTMTLEPMGVAP